MGKIYNAKGTCVGRVESSNNIYRVFDSESGTHCIGRIESNGKVYNADSGSGCCVGIVKSDGKVYNDVGERCLGHVTSDGGIYNTENYHEDSRVGSVSGGDATAGGAAGLTLLNLTSDGGNPPPTGFWGCVCAIGLWLALIWTANLGGKIGLGLGAIFIISAIATGMDVLNAVFVGLFATIVFGIVGAVIGGIVKMIIRAVRK